MHPISLPQQAPAMALAGKLWQHFGLPAPRIGWVAAAQLPAGFRDLLDHGMGMTSTLAQRWGEPIAVELLADDLSSDQRALFRFVVLRTEYSRIAVEIALIRIPLDAFSAEMRALFIEAELPFGSLLTQHGIVFHAQPQAFVTLKADSFLALKAAVPEGAPLYGRINQLIRDDGALLCETIELLPRA